MLLTVILCMGRRNVGLLVLDLHLILSILILRDCVVIGVILSAVLGILPVIMWSLLVPFTVHGPGLVNGPLPSDSERVG
jgi:hypothetical protein